MKVEILTIFPEIFTSFLSSSLIEKAIAKGELDISLTNFRTFANPPHYKVDDSPYGGGPGMVMSAPPLVLAVESAKSRLPDAKVILLTPAGKLFNQKKAANLSLAPELIIICGRYEGIDQRVSDLVVDEEISIGDFILMGGEVAAMAITEAVSRLLPGVIGNEQSSLYESFSDGMLEAPHYTRPAEFRGLKVPEVLLSGDHKEIAKWRAEAGMTRTQAVRPDLINNSK